MQARTNQQAQENRGRKRESKKRHKVTPGPHGHGSIFLGLRSSAGYLVGGNCRRLILIELTLTVRGDRICKTWRRRVAAS